MTPSIQDPIRHRRSRIARALLLSLCLSAPAAFATAAQAQGIDTPPAEAEAAVAIDTDAQALARFDLLYALSAHHPNERHRLYGQKAAATGNWRDAAKAFRMAARYADKYSQHRLSLLHWHGIGVREDRVLGYLWADIAAERGYPQFLAIRERMWRELTPAQQADVASRGPALYAEFGDPAAKPRFQRALAQSSRNVTGSRTGFDGGVGISSPDALRGTLANVGDALILATLHSPSRTDPQRYWAAEDRAWKNGIVRVGEIGDAEAGDPTAERQAPVPDEGSAPTP
jgi:uncharacterized protein